MPHLLKFIMKMFCKSHIWTVLEHEISCWQVCQKFRSYSHSSILSDLNIIAVILLDPLFVPLFLFLYHTCELSVDDDSKIANNNKRAVKWVCEGFWCVDLLHILMSIFSSHSLVVVAIIQHRKFNLQLYATETCAAGEWKFNDNILKLWTYSNIC